MATLTAAADLGIDTANAQGLFDWFLASLLFGRSGPQTQRSSRPQRLQYRCQFAGLPGRQRSCHQAVQVLIDGQPGAGPGPMATWCQFH